MAAAFAVLTIAAKKKDHTSLEAIDDIDQVFSPVTYCGACAQAMLLRVSDVGQMCADLNEGLNVFRPALWSRIRESHPRHEYDSLSRTNSFAILRRPRPNENSGSHDLFVPRSTSSEAREIVPHLRSVNSIFEDQKSFL